VILCCLNIAENAFPISHGIEPGPIRVSPLVISMIVSRSGSLTITAMIADVSITMGMYCPVRILAHDRFKQNMAADVLFIYVQLYITESCLSMRDVACG